MAITIGGLRLTSLSMSRSDNEEVKVTGNYSLISSTGVVLAKQGFNGHNEIVLGQSPETAKLLRDLQESVKVDLNRTLGLE